MMQKGITATVSHISPTYHLLVVIIALKCMLICNTSHGQQINPEADYRYGAVTWMQKSAEYRLLTQQTYRYAMSQLAIGIHDRKWSADEVQIEASGYEHKPPAIILDLDETVLDNSCFNARHIVRGTSFSNQSWNDWCREEKADAIPGALEFVKGAEGLGASIFFITNREDEVKEHTIRNLVKLGFPATSENVFTKNKDEGRGDDKLSRRAAVAEEFRVVLLIGDSMSDLCEGMDVPNTNRRNEVAAKKSELLGTRWIMFPNPSYGSWQRALPKGEKALETKD